MASDDARSAYAADLADLDKVTAKVNRARAHVAELEAEARKAVAKALHSCIAAGQNRTEVQKHSPFSPPTVRDIGEAAGIPPDERYVRTVKNAEPAPVTRAADRSLTRQEELLAHVRNLSRIDAAAVAKRLLDANPIWLRPIPGEPPMATIERAIREDLATPEDLGVG